MLEDRFGSKLTDELNNSVVFEHLDVALAVHSTWTSEQLRFLFPIIPAQTIIEPGNLSSSMNKWSPLFVHHITGQSGEVANRDSSVKSVLDQLSF